LLVLIILTAVFWYAVVPLAGAFTKRRGWHLFRDRFASLCGKPLLDYAMLRQNVCGEYHFIGNFESITEKNTLWIKNDNLTAPVFLKNAQTYVLPLGVKKHRLASMEKVTGSDFDVTGPSPSRLNWNRISALTTGAKVFIGGTLKLIDGRQVFTSIKGKPLLIIFYECSESALSAGVARAGRDRSEYWNTVTPYAFTGGVFSLIWIAQLFYARPVYRTTVLSAIAAIFCPLFPLLPPGLIFTLLYRRLWWQSCMYRIFRDIAMLPMKYAGPQYGYHKVDEMPEDMHRLIPADKPEKNESWYAAGIVKDGAVVGTPDTSFVPSGLIPGRPEVISRIYNRKALFYEISAWFVLAAGIALNVFFAELLIYFTR
jgi:hypothetical protein